MDFLTRKDPFTVGIEEMVRAEKSPTLEGIREGSKAALMAAPVGAAINGLRNNKDPKIGALIAGLGAGALVGLTAAVVQKYNNTKTEAQLRYHMRNMLDREPMVMMPPPESMQQLGFIQGFKNVRDQN